MIRTAVLSDCKTWRYLLGRDITPDGLTAFFCGVNPSTADASIDDHTVRKLYGFSSRLKIGRFTLVNKCAFRAKDIAALRNAADPIGPENDHYIEEAMRGADIHIVAWGPLAKLPPHLRTRWRSVTRIADKVGCKLYCLGVAQDGQPRHPLMLGYDAQLVEWPRP